MNTKERIDSLHQMLEKEPGDSFLNYALALEYQKMGNNAKAIHIIEEVLSRDENYLGAYLQLGQLYEDIGEGNKALVVYQRGCVVAQAQNNHKALAELNQAIFMLED